MNFDYSNYKTESLKLNDTEIKYRSYRKLEYCQKPKDDIQKMNIFVPEAYYNNETINGYDINTAPIFMPNTVGGYLPGIADEPGLNRYGHPNSIFEALKHGYIVASAGVRGRTSGKVSDEFFEGSKENFTGRNTGIMCGKAPAFIVDMKAAIRYLREFKDIPGNKEKIITNGTSAGGALSALTATSGNIEEYRPYLKEIGAYDQRDDIYAASIFCPIHNLENADKAYEWQFNKETKFYRTKHKKTDRGIERVPFNGEMTTEQIELSAQLKKLFPDYVNSLNLGLSLDENGEGSFKEYIKKLLIDSANKELKTQHNLNELSYICGKDSNINEQNYFIKKDSEITDFDFDAYIARITRMKSTPAFDSLDLSAPENDEFDNRHFSQFSYENSLVNGQIADKQIIRLMNPVNFVDNPFCAKHFRIRHGSFDRDTSLAIPAILTLLLKKNGIDVDFEIPWGLVHSGDYDLDELFSWIDSRKD